MTPQVYLRILQRLSGKPQLNRAEILKILKEMLSNNSRHAEILQMSGLSLDNISDDDLQKVIDRIMDPNGLVISEIFPAILGACSDAQRPSLAQIAIGDLFTHEANAMAIAVPSGGIIVAINYGLMDFIHVMTKIMCNLIIPPDRGRLHDLQACAQLAIQTAIAYLHHGIRVRSADVGIPHELIGFNATIVHMAETFVIAHEVGHILSGHLDEANLGKSLSMRDHQGNHVMTYNKSFDQELEADSVGVTLCLKIFPQTQSMALYACAWLFTLLQFLESVSGHLSSTHPPASIRMKIVEARKSELAEFAETLKAVQSYFEQVANTYKNNQKNG